MPTGVYKGKGKVVGTCDGGTKKIVYAKTPAAEEAPAKSTPPEAKEP